jgi:hypothetical protein
MGGVGATAKTNLDLLRTKVQALGGGNPYIVCLDSNAAAGSTLGCDAYSGYITAYANASNSEYPYSTLTGVASARWTAIKNTGAQCIPQITAGFDYRPRMGSASPYVGVEATAASWITNPTTAQWIAHVQASETFMQTFAANCQSGIRLHYAWNENTEGGFIMPHAGDNFGNRLRALAAFKGLPGLPRAKLATSFPTLLRSVI